MSNIIKEALANCTSIPDTPEVKLILNFFSDFIKTYGIFLKSEGKISFKLLTTGSCKANHFNIVLLPPDTSYGTFSKTLNSVPYGGSALANLLRNTGSKVTFDAKESNQDETYNHYLVEFTID